LITASRLTDAAAEVGASGAVVAAEGVVVAAEAAGCSPPVEASKATATPECVVVSEFRCVDPSLGADAALCARDASGTPRAQIAMPAMMAILKFFVIGIDLHDVWRRRL